MAERTTVRLPDELIRRAKRKAADEGSSLTALIEEGLRRLLDEHASTRNSPKVFPRISTATGGLRRGIDLDDAASLQEIDDIEYARRFR